MSKGIQIPVKARIADIDAVLVIDHGLASGGERRYGEGHGDPVVAVSLYGGAGERGPAVSFDDHSFGCGTRAFGRCRRTGDAA